jgi:hypothetical protein
MVVSFGAAGQGNAGHKEPPKAPQARTWRFFLHTRREAAWSLRQEKSGERELRCSSMKLSV